MKKVLKKRKKSNRFVILILLSILVLELATILIADRDFTGNAISAVKKIVAPNSAKSEGIIEKTISPSDYPSPSTNLPNTLLNSYLFSTNSQEPTIDQINQKIKQKGALWDAKENKISKLSEEQKKKLLGLKLTSEESEKLKKGQSLAKITASKSVAGVKSQLPDFFDWRNIGGKNYVTDVRDQASCGSCWAFGAVAVLEGHVNVYYNNPYIDLNLSEQDLVSCYLGTGCDGADTTQVEQVFSDYLQNIGISKESCFPYTATNNDCANKCSDWQQDAWKTLDYQSIDLIGDLPMRVNNIKQALINYGPIEVGMTVYSDFPSYSEGIYSHITNRILGYHAVTIIGFGTYDGLDYWIVKNSWGINWGEEGYFKILVGDSGIDSWFAFAVTEPNPPTTQNKICTDDDGDGYCYWGLGNKPSSGCPECDNVIEDCDDSNSSIFENCGINMGTGFLSIDSTPSNARIYVKDLVSGNWVYRGRTPTEFKLMAGEREIKLKSNYYFDYIEKVDIPDNTIKYVNLSLQRNPVYREGFPIQMPGGSSGRLSAPAVEDLDGDGTKEIAVLGNYDIYIYDNLGNLIWTKSFGEYPLQTGKFSTPTIGDIDNDGKKEVFVSWGQEHTNGSYNGKNLTNYCLYGWGYDGSSLEGFPANCSGDDLEFDPDLQAVIADLNNDGQSEIIATFVALIGDSENWTFKHKLYVFDNKGEILPNWPIEINSSGLPSVGDMIVADLNGDSVLEIIWKVYYYEKNTPYYIINYNGTIINSFYDDYIYSDENDSDVYDYDGGGLMAADIDNDGKSEFANKIMNTLIVFDSNGTRLWSDTSQRPNFGGASFGDLTGDGNPEIIFGDLSFYNCGRTYIYDSIKGTIINSWEIYPNCSMHLPKRGNALENMVADINNDGKNDIIASVWEVDFTGEFLTGYAYVYAWNSNGSIINGFPIYIPGDILLSPVLEDIDKDGKYEIIVSSEYLNSLLFVLDTDGNVNPNKKDWTQLNHDAQHTGCYDCDKLSNQLSCISNQSIGDINGDWNITQEDATRLISIIYNVSDPYYHTNDSTLMCCLDVNMDRSLTMADITKINRIVLGIDQSPGKCPLFCGDIDGSKKVNALDVTRLINYLYKGGVAPVSMWSANVNGDSAVNALDVTYLINYLYKGGASLKCAEPAKGLGANPTAGKTYSQAASELKSAQKTSVP